MSPALSAHLSSVIEVEYQRRAFAACLRVLLPQPLQVSGHREVTEYDEEPPLPQYVDGFSDTTAEVIEGKAGSEETRGLMTLLKGQCYAGCGRPGKMNRRARKGRMQRMRAEFRKHYAVMDENVFKTSETRVGTRGMRVFEQSVRYALNKYYAEHNRKKRERKEKKREDTHPGR